MDRKRKRARGGGATPGASDKATGTFRYDLGVPGLVAQCIEDMYRATGTVAAPRDRLAAVVVSLAVAIELYFGYEPGHYERGELLYGPIGAALGAVFGLIGGLAIAAALHFGAGPLLRPEAHALQLARTGRIRSASLAMRRAKWWIIKGGGGISRVLRFALNSVGLGRPDLPPDIAAANIEACEGIFAEAVGDTQAAAMAYIKALEHWPLHGFVQMSLLDLVVREDMDDIASDARAMAERFVENTRDKTNVCAAREYIELLKPNEEEPQGPTKVSEEESPYNKSGAEEKPIVLMKLVENPGSQISNGTLVVKYPTDERTIKLSPMPFQLMILLADTMTRAGSDRDRAQAGWVSINELICSLPWTTPNVTSSNVHKLVYKTRNTLEEHELGRNFIEDNANGCYRLCLPPDCIEVLRIATA